MQNYKIVWDNKPLQAPPNTEQPGTRHGHQATKEAWKKKRLSVSQSVQFRRDVVLCV